MWMLSNSDQACKLRGQIACVLLPRSLHCVHAAGASVGNDPSSHEGVVGVVVVVVVVAVAVAVDSS